MSKMTSEQKIGCLSIALFFSVAALFLIAINTLPAIIESRIIGGSCDIEYTIKARLKYSIECDNGAVWIAQTEEGLLNDQYPDQEIVLVIHTKNDGHIMPQITGDLTPGATCKITFLNTSFARSLTTIEPHEVIVIDNGE